MQKEFEFFITKVYHGVGAARKLGDIVKKVGAKKVMVFHGPNVKAAGLVDPCLKSLEEAGVPYVVYDKVEIESPMHSIEESAALGRSEGVDTCVAIGGGSCMDTAKVARMLITNPGTCRDYTTTRDREKLVPVYALLDPEMTVTLPKDMTGATGLDAMAHAVEGYLKPEAHVYSDPLCLQSMKMVYENLYNAWLHPDDLEARDNMLLASNIAMGGMADVGVQIGHGIGQALGAYTHAAHGVTCAWALPYVVEHLCDTEAPKIREIAKAFGLQLPEGASNVEVKDAVVGALKDLSAAVELPLTRGLGFTMEKDYENFVKFVMREQRLLQMSARPVTEENVRAYMTDLLRR